MERGKAGGTSTTSTNEAGTRKKTQVRRCKHKAVACVQGRRSSVAKKCLLVVPTAFFNTWERSSFKVAPSSTRYVFANLVLYVSFPRLRYRHKKGQSWRQQFPTFFPPTVFSSSLYPITLLRSSKEDLFSVFQLKARQPTNQPPPPTCHSALLAFPPPPFRSKQNDRCFFQLAALFASSPWAKHRMEGEGEGVRRISQETHRGRKEGRSWGGKRRYTVVLYTDAAPPPCLPRKCNQEESEEGGGGYGIRYGTRVVKAQQAREEAKFRSLQRSEAVLKSWGREGG